VDHFDFSQGENKLHFLPQIAFCIKQEKFLVATDTGGRYNYFPELLQTLEQVLV